MTRLLMLPVMFGVVIGATGHSQPADPPRDKSLDSALDLIAALTHAGSPDPDECIRGLMALQKCATPVRNKQIEEALNRAMCRPEPRVRAAAARVLGEVARLTLDYRGADLSDLLADPDKTVRAAALDGLSARRGSYRPHEIRMLARMVREDEPALRFRAYGHLRRAGELGRADFVMAAVPAVIDRLETELTDPNPGLNLLRQAVESLGKIGHRSPRTVPALLKVYARFPAATAVDADMRQTVVAALADIGPFSDKSLPFLVKLMQDEKLPLDERAWAAWAVGHFGPPAAAHVPELIALIRLTLKQAQPKSVANIMDGLTSLGESAEPAVPYLIELAQGPTDAEETISAIRTLAALGVAARHKAAPVLAKLYFAKSRHPLDHELGKALVDFEEVTTPLALDALKTGDEGVQLRAIEILHRLGPNARTAVPELLRIAKDKFHPLRGTAIIALKRIER